MASKGRRGGNLCCAHGCKNSTSSPGMSFYRIPKTFEQGKLWLERAGRKDLLKMDPAKWYTNLRMCAQHFEETQFFSSGRLVWNAKPTIFQERRYYDGSVAIPSDTGDRERDRDEVVASGSDRKQVSERKDGVKALEEIELTRFQNFPGDQTLTDASHPGAEESATVNEQVTESFFNGNGNDEFMTSTPKRGNSRYYSRDELTPRRVALRSKLQQSRVLVCKLRRKYHRLRGNTTSDDDVMGKMEKALSPAAYSLISSNMKLCKRSKFGRRWNDLDKVTALSLAFHSRKSYRALRQIFMLPAVSSLSRWLSGFKLTAGLSYPIFKGLQSVGSKLDDKDKICVLNLDEISIKEGLFYDRCSDSIVGYVDSGNGANGNTNATCALVLMARGLCKHWKQPVGFMLGSGACDVDAVCGILTEAIREMTKAGFSVVASVCDQGSNFIQLHTKLGVTSKKPFYYVDGQKVFFLFDSCHLLKATRNNLLRYNFEFGGFKASWRDIIMVYERDIKRKYRQAPKLTPACVYPNNFQRMKVAFCCRVFSNTVAGMLEVASDAVQHSSAIGTAEFVGRMDQLFDCFNSTVKPSTKVLRRPMTGGTDHLKVFEDSLALFESLKVYDQDHKDVTGRIKCIKGWKVTINATIMLWKYLCSNFGISQLCLRRLNQDCLENFFGQIRQRGGGCRNPTAYQFQQAYKHLSYRSMILSSPSGNCELDPDHCMLVFKEIVGLGQQPSSVRSSDLSLVGPDDADKVAELMQWDIGERQAFVYVAGVVLRKLLLWHHCPHCKMLEVSSEGLTNEDQKFIHLKAFDKSSPFGSLTVPSTVFLDYLLACEAIFGSVMKKSDGGRDIISQSLELALTTLSSPMCDEAPLVKVLGYFFRIRIYYSLKFRNREKK